MTSLQKWLLAVVLCSLPSCLFAQVGGVYIDSAGMLKQTKHITDDVVLKHYRRMQSIKTSRWIFRVKVKCGKFHFPN